MYVSVASIRKDNTMKKQTKNIYQKLSDLQCELKVPKNQINTFGKYKYRSCEDIVESAKQIAKKHGLTIMISDDIKVYGNRVYVNATVTIYDNDSEDKISNNAFAREPEIKKGMDESQITGTASSYARKYALNGILLLDDTKDVDVDEKKQTEQFCLDLIKQTNTNQQEVLKYYQVKKIEDLTPSQFNNLIQKLSKKTKDVKNEK